MDTQKAAGISNGGSVGDGATDSAPVDTSIYTITTSVTSTALQKPPQQPSQQKVRSAKPIPTKLSILSSSVCAKMSDSKLRFQSLDDLGNIKTRSPPKCPQKQLDSLTSPGDIKAETDLRSVLPAGAIAVFTEAVATSLLVLLGCMGCIHIPGQDAPSLLQIVLTFGFVVMFNIQIFGHVSGAHMNPAVTAAAVLMGVTPPLRGAAYVLAQCAGAVAGFGVLTLLVPSSSAELAPEGYCNTEVFHELTAFQGLIVEIAITSILIFLNCAFWDPVNKDKTDGLAIKFGLTIVGLSLAGGPLTGASMNPARSLGPAVWNSKWTHHWVYWVGPLFSAVFASLLYKVIFQSKHEPAPPADPAEAVPLSLQEKSAGGAA